MNEFEAFSTTNFEPSERGQKHGRPLQLPVPPLALDAREGPGARVARPALPLGHQPQAHVRGSAPHSRAQHEKPRGERLHGGGEPRETPRRGRRRRRRRARALGEPSRQGAAQAAATRAMGQDLEHPRRRVLAALVLGGELRALPRGSSPSREADRRGERRGSHAADDRIVAGRRRLHAERRG